MLHFVTSSRSENGHGFYSKRGVKTGVVNDIFWSEIGSEYGELGGTPHQEFPGTPTGLLRGCKMNIFYLFVYS